jgi:hypothetical protein
MRAVLETKKSGRIGLAFYFHGGFAEIIER